MPTLTSTINNFSTTELQLTIVNNINNLLNSILPNNPLWLVFGISLLLAYRIKRQTNAGNVAFIIYTIVFWGALRYFGIGG